MIRSLDRAKPVHKKPWASLIAIAALFASASASAGELDGKAIVCANEKFDQPLGFEFINGQVRQFTIYKHSTVASVSEFADPMTYEALPTKVKWGLRVLERDSLQMQFIDDGEVLWSYSCEVAVSLQAFREKMESARLEAQRKIDEQMKDNKI